MERGSKLLQMLLLAGILSPDALPRLKRSSRERFCDNHSREEMRRRRQAERQAQKKRTENAA